MYALPKVDFCTALGNAFKNYSNFSGRIRRSEYWFFMLVVNILTFLFSLLEGLYASGIIRTYYYYYDSYYGYSDYRRKYNYDAITALMIILVIYIAFIMLPTLSATVRRLHDIGKRGEYIFVGLIPFFGGLTLLVYLCRDSMMEENEFGPSPKYTQNLINPVLQVQPQNYMAPLLPNDNYSINNVSNDNVIIPNQNINVVSNNNIITQNKNNIAPSQNINVVSNNNIIAQNKNNIVPNQKINVVSNNDINSNNSKPVQMNELSENKENKNV